MKPYATLTYEEKCRYDARGDIAAGLGRLKRLCRRFYPPGVNSRANVRNMHAEVDAVIDKIRRALEVLEQPT